MVRTRKPDSQPRTYQLQVLIEVDEDGKYVAWCPALEACYTQADTFEESVDTIREVIALCLEELREAKHPIDLRYPAVIGIKQVEVKV